jgi:DNA-binding PadR family transcriptional regulator
MPMDRPRFHVLLALAKFQPSHAAAIRDHIVGDTLGAMYIKPSSLYVLLKKLGQQGLIEQAGPAIPYKQPYRLTDKGRHRLKIEIQLFEHIAELGQERL